MKNNITCYSIVPGLYNEVGHFYEYMLSFEKSTRINGWRHVAFIPKSCFIKKVPKGWIPSLPVIHSHDKSLKDQLKLLAKNCIFFISLFGRLGKKRRAVVFIEQYTLPILAAMTLAALIRRPKISFWHMLRFGPEQLKCKGKLNLFFHLFFEYAIGAKNAIFLTDSEMIAEGLRKEFKRFVHVLPIPHGSSDFLIQRESSIVKCWWPGMPRDEKGLDRIKRISDQLRDSSLKMELYLSDSLQNDPHFTHTKARFIPLHLFRQQYDELMNTVHIVLLPYKQQCYQGRSSGILIEAVNAGAMPFVSDKTWMAYELRKYELDELILDWENERNIPEYIGRIFYNPKTWEKLNKMRESYRAFHNEKSFGDVLKSIFKKVSG